MVGGPDEYARPLRAYGMEQAAALAPEIASYAPVRVLSSPYLRSVRTVEPAAALLGLAVERRADLREWDSGIGPTPDWREHYLRCWAEPAFAFPGGESHDALKERAVAALRDVAALEGTSVVASHGNWIARALQGLGWPVDAAFWLAMPMPALYVVEL